MATRAVLAARAADRDRHVPLALAAVAGGDELEQLGVAVEELLGAGLVEDVAGDLLVEAGEGAQLRDPVRVGQEAAVDDEVGVDRQAVLVAEGHDGGPQLGLLVAGELGVHLGAQLVHVQAGGVDHQVGVAAQLAQQVALGGDAVDDAAVALERVRAAHRLEAAHQGVVRGLQEDDAPGDVLGLQVGEGLAEVVEEAAAADVDDDRDAGDVALRAGAELHHGGDQRGRQVVDDEPAEVLQTLGRGAAAGSGHAGDDHQLGDRRLARPRLVVRSAVPVLTCSPPSSCSVMSPAPVVPPRCPSVTGSSPSLELPRRRVPRLQ